jgi:hypothetical protein
VTALYSTATRFLPGRSPKCKMRAVLFLREWLQALREGETSDVSFSTSVSAA